MNYIVVLNHLLVEMFVMYERLLLILAMVLFVKIQIVIHSLQDGLEQVVQNFQEKQLRFIYFFKKKIKKKFILIFLFLIENMY